MLTPRRNMGGPTRLMDSINVSCSRLFSLLFREDTPMKFQRLVLVLVGLLLIVGIGASAPVAQAQTETPPTTKLYVGTLSDAADVFVGLAITGDDVTLYICDGQADKKTVSFG